MIYSFNIELLLIILNFTKRFDLLICILSVYNLILMIVSNIYDNKKILISATEIKQVSNNTLFFLSVISIINTSSGIIMTLLSITFGILYLNNNITIKTKNNDLYKYIVASIFIIISCIRFNIGYDYLWTTHYLTFFVILLIVLLLCFEKFRNNHYISMIYIMVVAICLSLIKDFMIEDITMAFLISILSNLIAIILLCIKSEFKIFKYIKTFYAIVFILAIIRYLYITYSLSSFNLCVIVNILLISAYCISNFILLSLYILLN